MCKPIRLNHSLPQTTRTYRESTSNYHHKDRLWQKANGLGRSSSYLATTRHTRSNLATTNELNNNSITSPVWRVFVANRTVTSKRFCATTATATAAPDYHPVSSSGLNLRPWNDTVPRAPEESSQNFAKHVKHVADFVKNKQHLVVLTGAGISTESSLPDYRSPNGSYSKGHKPVSYQEFAKSHYTRQRYWARSFLGWSLFASSKPNAAHFALAELEARGIVKHIITQNVDLLHQKASSKNVLELHGTLTSVICNSCKTLIDRREFQQKLIGLNPSWFAELQTKLNQIQATEASSSPSEARADGDIEPSLNTDYSTFQLPNCDNCGSFYKPNVVMFGENVPKHIVNESFRLVSQSDGLLILGTSLQVFSIYRLVRYAHDIGIPFGIINIGETRADQIAQFKYQHQLGPFLTALVEELNQPTPTQ